MRRTPRSAATIVSIILALCLSTVSSRADYVWPSAVQANLERWCVGILTTVAVYSKNPRMRTVVLKEYADFLDEHFNNATDKATVCELGGAVLTNIAIKLGLMDSTEDVLALNRKALVAAGIRYYCNGSTLGTPEVELFCAAPSEDTFASVARAEQSQLAAYPETVFATEPRSDLPQPKSDFQMSDLTVKAWNVGTTTDGRFVIQTSVIEKPESMEHGEFASFAVLCARGGGLKISLETFDGAQLRYLVPEPSHPSGIRIPLTANEVRGDDAGELLGHLIAFERAVSAKGGDLLIAFASDDENAYESLFNLSGIEHFMGFMMKECYR